MQTPDIEALRCDARERALGRPRVPFDGMVRDEPIGSVPARWYEPARRDPAGFGVVFFHGGYGLFGGLELQDGYCRRIAGALTVTVVSVAYRLAPEATLTDAAADAVAGAEAIRAIGIERVVFWGDSAGGAVALAAARDARADGLALTNPNVDLTVVSYDDEAPGGPGRELSEWSFTRWAGGGTLSNAPDLAANARGLPPFFVAVGANDSLLSEAQRLVAAGRLAGVPAHLRNIPDAAHGFMGGPDVAIADEVIREAGRFFGLRQDPRVADFHPAPH